MILTIQIYSSRIHVLIPSHLTNNPEQKLFSKLKINLMRLKSQIAGALRINQEVCHALQTNRPVVALESTIITHGLPYPANIQMAQNVEAIVRAGGAVPATMGYIGGEAVVGCNSKDLEMLGDPSTPKMKVSRRDIPTVIARRITGGTTIATTMDLCKRASIDVFATGGLGGVSRPHDLMDVSADLEELGQTPVGVVCSGPKSILDVARTLEYLETKGVMVATMVDDARMADLIRAGVVQSQKHALELIARGETLGVNVPGFYVRDSGIPSPYVFESSQMAAELLYASKYQMGLPAGQVFCVPAPVEAELDRATIQRVIDDSLAEAELTGVRGKALTPFLLGRINKVTNGESVKCNVAFVENNARIGAEVAKAVAELKGGAKEILQPVMAEPKPNATKYTDSPPKCIVVGSVAVDTICKTNTTPIPNDSNPGSVKQSLGGVGFNVARAAHDSKPLFVSAVNLEDASGQHVKHTMEALGMSTAGLVSVPTGSTAQYVSVHDNSGELIVACADMDIVETLTIEQVRPFLAKHMPNTLVMDANISTQLMSELLAECSSRNISVVYEPTSAAKCGRLAHVNSLPVFPKTPITLGTPTVRELMGLADSLASAGKMSPSCDWFPVVDALNAGSLRTRLDVLSHKHSLVASYLKEGLFQRAIQVLPYVPRLVIKDGANGVTIVEIVNLNETEQATSEAHTASQKTALQPSWSLLGPKSSNGVAIAISHYPPAGIEGPMTNVTGAGDALLGSLLNQVKPLGSYDSTSRSTAVSRALTAASRALSS